MAVMNQSDREAMLAKYPHFDTLSPVTKLQLMRAYSSGKAAPDAQRIATIKDQSEILRLQKQLDRMAKNRPQSAQAQACHDAVARHVAERMAGVRRSSGNRMSDTDKINSTRSTPEAFRFGSYLAVLEGVGASDDVLSRGRAYLDPLLRSEDVTPAKREEMLLRGNDIPRLVDVAFALLVLLENEQKAWRRAFLCRQLERVWTAILRRWRRTNAPRRI